jgi:Tol biopolymer transport system component
MKRFNWFLLILCISGGGCRAKWRGETAVTATNTPIASSGQLIFIEINGGDQYLAVYDLESEKVNRLFSVPENGWLAKADASPYHSLILLAYSHAPPEGQVQFGYTNLFLFTDGETELTELYQKSIPEEVLYNPVWSHDGTAVYFSHVIPDTDDFSFTNTLERLNVANQERIDIAEHAFWPRLSTDGTQLTYATINPTDLSNALYVANPDGTEAVQLLPETAFQVIDVPMFSPDGEWIYFTAAENPVSTRPWWERLLGIETAVAHNIPADWWRIPVNGGEPERLTAINEVGLYGVFGEDGRIIYFASTTGLYQMNLDGSQLTQLLETMAAPSLSWQPSNQ